MAKIVLSTTGSLGDLHPMIALGLELRKRGHEVVVNSWQGYEEKVTELGFGFAPLRPSIDPNDRELIRKSMDGRKGSEMVVRELVFPNLRDMYDDVVAACNGADAFLSGELIYVSDSVEQTTGVKWISTSLQPLSMFSSHDPNIYPTLQWHEHLRPLPVLFHRQLFMFLRMTIRHWYRPYEAFRRELGLDEGHDPLFEGKFSKLLHLAMFSEAISRPQPDWPQPTTQTGFCFYDESETGSRDSRLDDFLASGEPPIVFTLGTAAVLDARDFFDQSAAAARKLGRRAILLYGRENDPPAGLTDDVVGFPYAPYSLVFPKAACVVHQAGIGTTAQVLRAGVPHLIMPYSHDQPDNAARCRRAGVAEIIHRDRYTADSAAAALLPILTNSKYRENAQNLKRIVDRENGTFNACDAIEDIL